MADAKLIADRLSDDSTGGDVVLAHNDLEDALSKMLGVTVGRQISASVLGTAESDGQISVIRFHERATVGSPEQASGLEFYDGLARKRLIMINGELQIWEADDPADDNTTWTLVLNLEEEVEPALTTLSDVAITTKTQGLVLGWNLMQGGDLKITLKQNEVAEDGAQEFLDLDDISAFEGRYTGHTFDPVKIGWLLAVKSLDSLQPIPAEEEGSESFSALSFVQTLGFVPFSGVSQNWKTMAWRISSIEDLDQSITTVSTYNGVANAGITLSAGLWRATLVINPLGDRTGFLSWKMVGAESFPVGFIGRYHMPYEGVNAPDPMPFQVPPSVNGWVNQEQYLVVGEETTVALMMGKSSQLACSAVAGLTLQRII